MTLKQYNVVLKVLKPHYIYYMCILYNLKVFTWIYMCY